jgi:hypothetical protein
MKVSEQRALTLYRAQRMEQMRTPNEGQRAMGTHTLSSAEGGKNEESERGRGPASGGHSLSVKRREGQVRILKGSQRGALTNCRARREGQVRILKECQRATGTHQLSSAEAGTSEDTVRNQRAKTLTNCRAPSEEQVRIAKGSKRAKGTHILSSAEKVTS